jgi:hypothetical protein
MGRSKNNPLSGRGQVSHLAYESPQVVLREIAPHPVSAEGGLSVSTPHAAASVVLRFVDYLSHLNSLTAQNGPWAAAPPQFPPFQWDYPPALVFRAARVVDYGANPGKTVLTSPVC